ncbi:hypothetical protein JX265_007776 [Neoarthrinium moseri]|uniref:Uncharacterized protein n=1 Tax=Neoarthrinium moseri TaxID=1658444 RepID=A0A9P9WJC9_9PEZI|nr:hypothetical protein JX265_007776 [Neoarthrinium moseri]
MDIPGSQNPTDASCSRDAAMMQLSTFLSLVRELYEDLSSGARGLVYTAWTALMGELAARIGADPHMKDLAEMNAGAAMVRPSYGSRCLGRKTKVSKEVKEEMREELETFRDEASDVWDLLNRDAKSLITSPWSRFWDELEAICKDKCRTVVRAS